jgi:hypothetical protein
MLRPPEASTGSFLRPTEPGRHAQNPLAAAKQPTQARKQEVHMHYFSKFVKMNFKDAISATRQSLESQNLKS